MRTFTERARCGAVPMASVVGEGSGGCGPVGGQRSLRDARKISAAPRHGQLWIRVSNAKSSRFAIALAPKGRTEPLPHNAILVIGDYASLDSGDFAFVEVDEQTFTFVKLTDGEKLIGYDIESTSKRRPILINEQAIIGKVVEIIMGTSSE